VQEIVQSWEEGFLIYGVSEGQAHHFEPLLRALSTEIQKSGCALETAVPKIDRYFSLLPPGGQYFRLLRDYPWLLEKIIAPILLSPTMTSLLHQSPHIIDRFLEQAQLESQNLDTTIVFSNPDYEYRLENLRRLANEELYLRYSRYFEGETGVLSFQGQLTTLAESLLAASIQVACDEMGLEDSPIAIIGMGKLGSIGMMPKSDLDLVYLCESMETHALASKFSSRLNTIINSPMREGRVYELDTRLRPSGQSGSVTISLQSYQRHQLNRAHTWSHLALVPARFVAGNLKVGKQFADIKREILSAPRDLQQFKLDCAKMLKRVQDQRILPAKADQFSAKLRPGGLFELEYLLNCIAILYYIENPSSINLDFNALTDALAKQYGKDILSARKCLQALQLEIRLFGHDDMRFSELPGPILAHVLKTMHCDNTNSLVEEITQAIEASKRLIDQFFKEIDPGGLSDWEEIPVSWIN
jgi:glutamate-ammonia-ligase adenylyltransferase